MKRFRIFAGPNGSGKTTIINQIRQTTVHGHAIDFGVYINADEIAIDLLQDRFTFAKYEVVGITMDMLIAYAIASGLFRNEFHEPALVTAVAIENDRLHLLDITYKDAVAQLLSNFLVGELLKSGKKCSMETVFSHVSKLQFMQYAKSLGYKVYLYFVTTADADINVARVAARVALGGHPVSEDRIRDRYVKSLDLMYAAAQESYQAYFFDNSGQQEHHQQIAHFKVVNKKKKWDAYNPDDLPDWFIKYYVNKQPKK